MVAKFLFINSLSILVLIIAPKIAVGADLVAEKAPVSTPEGPPGEAENAAGETQQTWWERHVKFIGDARAALAFKSRGDRDGEHSSEVTPAVRLRGGAAVSFLPWLDGTARLALRIDDDIEGFDFRFNYNEGIEAGDVTFDELFLALKADESLTIKGGRLQTAFEVDSVVKNSLSRHDSSGLDITWTDGVYGIIGRPSAFRLHLIGQVNPDDGPTNGVGDRGPMDYEDDASRVTYYVGLEAPPPKAVHPALCRYHDHPASPPTRRPGQRQG